MSKGAQICPFCNLHVTHCSAILHTHGKWHWTSLCGSILWFSHDLIFYLPFMSCFLCPPYHNYNHTDLPLSTRMQINYSAGLRCINCLKRWILDRTGWYCFWLNLHPFACLQQFSLNLIPSLYNRTFQGVLELIVLQCWERRQKSALPIVPWFCHFWSHQGGFWLLWDSGFKRKLQMNQNSTTFDPHTYCWNSFMFHWSNCKCRTVTLWLDKSGHWFEPICGRFVVPLDLSTCF